MTSPSRAPAAVAALLAEIVDDAGLFPPASMGMVAAVDAHLGARSGDYRWMLGRFLCPADRLAELAGTIRSDAGAPVRLGVILSGGAWPDVVGVVDGPWRVEAVEARLPDGDVGRRTDELVGLARSLGAERAWIEIPWTELPAGEWGAAAKAVAAVDGAGIKVRCGGERADAFPPPALLGSIVAACRDAGAPMKATAGLHHPFRHPDPSLGIVSHGFVNLAVAVVLARHADLDEGEIAAVLTEDDSSAFTLGASSVGWRGREVDADHVAETRQSLAFAGFGSCSFREPVDDLVALGVLP